jgi:GNAT superfamily N-acetyltransferase
MPDLDVRIEPVTAPAQIAQVARLHRSEVGEGFLSSLGEPVLRMLYAHAASSRHCALFAAYADAEPVGYICGTRDTAALYRDFVRRRWWVALPTVAPKLLAPQRLVRAVETLRYPHRGGSDLPRAEVVNFVVVPAARGRGVAAALFHRLMRWFEAEGCAAIKIVTGERQVRAHGLYEKLGAQPHGRTSIHRGSPSRIYVYPLGDRRPPVEEASATGVPNDQPG